MPETEIFAGNLNHGAQGYVGKLCGSGYVLGVEVSGGHVSEANFSGYYQTFVGESSFVDEMLAFYLFVGSWVHGSDVVEIFVDRLAPEMLAPEVLVGG